MLHFKLKEKTRRTRRKV